MRLKNPGHTKLAIVAIGLTLISKVGASALVGTTPIAPGTTVFPGLVPPGTDPGVLLAVMSSPFQFAIGGGPVTGTFASAVYQDGGTLDFYYQVTNSVTSSGEVAQVSANIGPNGRAGFRIDGTSVGAEFMDGGIPPFFASLSADGQTLDMSWPSAGSGILPGMTSAVLVTSSDTLSYTTGAVSIYGAGVEADVPALGPGPIIPSIAPTCGSPNLEIAGLTNVNLNCGTLTFSNFYVANGSTVNINGLGIDSTGQVILDLSSNTDAVMIFGVSGYSGSTLDATVIGNASVVTERFCDMPITTSGDLVYLCSNSGILSQMTISGNDPTQSLALSQVPASGKIFAVVNMTPGSQGTRLVQKFSTNLQDQPEPKPIFLLGSGLLLIGIFGYRSRQVCAAQDGNCYVMQARLK